MPDLTWNSAYWDGGYEWQTGGEEWSEIWGGSEAQWFGSLYPRIHRFLPASSVLEIAPGFGRWTKFLLGSCQDYLGIDLSEQCIARCRDIFRDAEHARFLKNDGLSLGEALDNHFDFVFTFDSLVHVELDVMSGYIRQIIRKLSPQGVAFLHHSNMAGLPDHAPNLHARGITVSARTVADAVEAHGGKVLLQERMNWGGSRFLTDCLTLMAGPEHAYTGPAVQIDNELFIDEALLIRKTHAPYTVFFLDGGRPDPGL